MKRIILAVPLLVLTGCATGESYRTMMPDGTKYEAKRSGIWFAGKIAPLVQPDNGLEIK